MSGSVILETAASSRSTVYWFLSTFYLVKPDKTFLEELGKRIRDLGEDAGTEFAAELRILGQILGSGDPGLLAEQLAVEFTRLFRGLKEGYGPPPPYESVYRESRLMGETAIRVMSRYLDAGFGAIDESAGPQDHIGVELKFMALLCHEGIKANEAGDSKAARVCLERQQSFLADHLLQWLPALCGTIEAQAHEDFYRAVARLTRHVADRDLIYIRSSLEEAA